MRDYVTNGKGGKGKKWGLPIFLAFAKVENASSSTAVDILCAGRKTLSSHEKLLINIG